jgi:hypothetical protein
MNHYAVPLMLIVVSGIFFAGCTQAPGSSPVTPVVPAATLPPQETAPPVPTAVATAVPEQVVTIIHQVSQVRDIKDSELLFALQVPVEWDVTTHKLVNPEDTEGLGYQTDLLGDNVFTIQTYAISRSQDQAYRDTFRKWSPAPVETTVTINDITYERFESTSDGTTRVAYVARKSSANERGFASVLIFTAHTSNPFEKEDFEKVVSSFRYFPASVAGTMPGTEIERISSPSGSSGGANSVTGSGDSGSSAGCSRCGV